MPFSSSCQVSFSIWPPCTALTALLVRFLNVVCLFWLQICFSYSLCLDMLIHIWGIPKNHSTRWQVCDTVVNLLLGMPLFRISVPGSNPRDSGDFTLPAVDAHSGGQRDGWGTLFSARSPDCVSGSWLQLDPVLAITDIWAMNQWMVCFCLFVSLPLSLSLSSKMGKNATHFQAFSAESPCCVGFCSIHLG